MEKPIVSILCIAYNHRPYIQECLDSLLAQKVEFTFEIIIHDDASTDGTAEIIKEYELHYPDIVKPIYQTENQYSKGIRTIIVSFMMAHVCGKYIAICEGDDYWCDENKLQRQVDFLEKNKDFGMCYSQVIPYFQVENRFSKRSLGGPHLEIRELLKNNCIPTLSVCIRKDIYERYVEDVRVLEKDWMMGDWPLWIWVSFNSKIYFENRVTGVYRVLPDSASHFLDVEKAINFARSRYDIKKYFASRYSIEMTRRDLEFNHNRMIGWLGFQKLNREMILDGFGKTEELNLKEKLCLFLSYSRFSFQLVQFYKNNFQNR